MIRRHPVRTALAGLLVLVVVAAAGLAYLARKELEPVQRSQTEQVVVTVARNESLATLVDTLGRDRVVRSTLFFSIYAHLEGLGSKLHQGRFILDRGMGPSEVVTVLEGPPSVIPIRVTLPDGLRAQQEAARLQSDGLFSSSAYLSQVEQGEFNGISQLPGAPAGASWEGMAFGDTYEVDPNITAHEFLRLQLEDFDRRVRSAITDGASQVGLTPYQVLVLASVVEAEATTQKDRDLVAGVFFNRLRDGMPLQSDVTVLYAMAVAGDSNATFSTNFPSPYNTYLHAGLPPGPIDSPGTSALEAVLHPASTNYMYFLSLPNGKMLFAVTAAQHQQQVNQAGLG
ncbi:MAG: endolytic transglycosylase MltG [Candidatus Dormibacteraeota bacterium]|nr:endolytic transglycosylase MltG [Candidatus Dormibacteraeota bacterium]